MIVVLVGCLLGMALVGFVVGERCGWAASRGEILKQLCAASGHPADSRPLDGADRIRCRCGVVDG